MAETSGELMKRRLVILTLLDYYLPGYRAGGALRTVSHMVDQLGDATDFRIVARDHDITVASPYPDVQVDTWNRVGRAEVFYASSGHLSFPRLRNLVQAAAPDILYLNSFFSTLTIKCLALRRAGLLPAIPVVLAPRGEFSPGALALKRKKKRLYIAFSKRIGLYRDILWHASTAVEQSDIAAVFGHGVPIHVAPDVPALVTGRSNRRMLKSPGEARFVFLSRISPKKNLHHALEMLRSLSGRISLSIAGPLEDTNYWDVCQRAIAQLPGNVEVSVAGAVPHENVHDLLSQQHFFLLPTLGENYGHAILESLAAGVPVVISDQTPWRELAPERVGWSISLDDESRWQAVLQQCVDMRQAEYDQMSSKARAFAIAWSHDDSILEANRRLFDRAVSI
jgi:glycosyltransferase involved in cell wall biosynthesis